MPSMIVAGAGTAGVNGTYTETGTSGGKPYYNLSGTATNQYCIVWISAESIWKIFYDNTFLHFYYSFDNVATPDLVTTWFANFGSPPVPTVTAAGAGATPKGPNVYPQILVQ